jgi:hypothetical protein
MPLTLEEKAKWFDAALRFGLKGSIHLVMKSKINGKANWAIVDTKTNKVLNSNLEWEEEPPAKKRDEAFLMRTRFDFETAVQLFQQYLMFAQGS